MHPGALSQMHEYELFSVKKDFENFKTFAIEKFDQVFKNEAHLRQTVERYAIQTEKLIQKNRQLEQRLGDERLENSLGNNMVFPN